MKDKIGNTKTFLIKTSIVLLVSVLAVCSVISWILIIFLSNPPPTGRQYLVIYIVGGILLLLLLFTYIFEGSGTVRFTEDRIIVKKWFFSRRRHLLYSEIGQISIFYGYIPLGLRSACGHSISIFRKKSKNPAINIEITYHIVAELMKHTEGIRIRVGYSSLLKFSKKHRALLWNYLRENQKEELLRRLNKKQK